MKCSTTDVQVSANSKANGLGVAEIQIPAPQEEKVSAPGRPLDGFGRMWDCWKEGNDSFPVICNRSQEDEF